MAAALSRATSAYAIHSLARFIGTRSPEHLDWCLQVRSIPFKKATKTVIGYLDKRKWRNCCALRSPHKSRFT